MRRNLARTVTIAILAQASISVSVLAQVSVRGGFLQDSVRVGDYIDYYLAARYPSSLTVVFPDSSFQFGPFEYHRKRYFPTTSSSGESYDSTVYTFQSFELDEVQHLTLPVFAVNAGDCTRYLPLRDSVFFRSLLTGPVPDSVSAQDLPLRDNTLYQRVRLLFNYPVFVISIVSVTVLLAVGWLIFGKRIRRYFKVKRMKKSHQKFVDSFNRILQQLGAQFSAQQTEVALSIWKKYLEQLEQKPYTKLTTRETIRMEKDDVLGQSLHHLDRAIYGNHTAVNEPLERLARIAEDRFVRKLEDVKNG